ncbi:MAG: potassium channel family protein [Desulfobacterales bacterium]|nr:potassium channel family protein [Desulfobacterales bacterium]
MSPSRESTPSVHRRGWLSPFVVLVAAILTMVLTTPFLQDYIRLRLILDFFYTAIFLAVMYVVSQEKRRVKVAAVLAVPMIISLWAPYFFTSDHLVSVGRICGIIFFGIAIHHCGRFVAQSPQVTRDVIVAAVVIYLLMALMWSFAYALLEFYQPGSFNAQEGLTRESRPFFLYYSFVTLTTLGFGDITPLTEKAKALTILQAFIGQVYLVVVLAWLVGMHVSRKAK